jgi:hypothetical protein
MMTYHGRGNECSIVHVGVSRKIPYGTTEKLIDPERHCVDQEENGQLDADQNREKILWKDISIYAA